MRGGHYLLHEAGRVASKEKQQQSGIWSGVAWNMARECRLSPTEALVEGTAP